MGLYFYGARWYDPALGRFIQPDTIVPQPGDAADWDRFAYVRNNPLKYTDPSGHVVCEDCVSGGGGGAILLYWTYKIAEAVQRYGPQPGEVITGPEDLIVGPGIGMISEASIAGARALFRNARINGVFSQGSQATGEVGERIGTRIMQSILRGDGERLYADTGFEAAYHGFDGLYRNTETGHLAVVEYKTNTTGRLDLPITNHDRQMSNRWLEHKTGRMQDARSTQYSPLNAQLAKELRAELRIQLAVERISVVVNYDTGDVNLYLPVSSNSWQRVGDTISLE